MHKQLICGAFKASSSCDLDDALIDEEELGSLQEVLWNEVEVALHLAFLRVESPV